MRKLIIALICLCFAPVAQAEIVSVCNMPSSASVQVRIYDISDTTEDVAWTNTGVTERAVGLSKSCYYYNATLTPGNAYQIDWRDAASPTKVASEAIYQSTSRVDVAVSTRGTSVYAGGAVESVTGAVGSVTAGVTVTTNNDKTGYTVSTVQDKTGYTVSTVQDKTGYSLSQTFPTNFSSLSITEAGKVAAATLDDKTGYTVSTVSDKTGYSLASTQTFDMTGSITGNLSGSVGSVTGAVGSVTGGVTVTTNNDKTGYALTGDYDAAMTALTVSGYTAPDNASIAAIKAKTDNLPTDPASNTQVATRASQTSVNAIPTNPTLQTTWTDAKAGYITGTLALDSTVAKDATVAKETTLTTLIPEAIPFTDNKVDANATATVDNAAIADAVWDEALSGHTGAGSAGLALATASAAGDPWSVVLGTYGSGTAGKIVYDNLNATISSRPTLTQIEASAQLLRKTSGSTTNLVGVSADYKVNANAGILESDKTEIAQAVWDSDKASTRKLTSAYTDEASPRDMAATGGTGTGATHVNHDTGGTDNLTYQTAGGVGIWGATVKAYLKTDYDAGNTSDAYVKGYTTTKIDGTWTSDLMLDAGFTYTIEFYKAGSYGPNTKEVTI